MERRRSSLKGRVRNSSSTKSLKDDCVVLRTRRSRRPALTSGMEPRSRITSAVLITSGTFTKAWLWFESDVLDVESTELTDIPAFDTDHKEEFETLLVDEEENYQRDVKSLLKLFVDIITPSHSKNLQDGGLL